MAGLIAHLERTESRPSNMLIHYCKAEPYFLEHDTNRFQRELGISPVRGGKSLLDIPPELRLMIYSFLSPQEPVYQIIDTDRNRILTWAQDFSIQDIACLSRSCKTIHHEVNDRLYGSLKVMLQGWLDPHSQRKRETKMIWRSLHHLPRHLKHVHCIGVWLDLAWTSYNLLDYLRDVKPIIPALRHSAKLKTFEFVLTSCEYLSSQEPEAATGGHASSKQRELDRAEKLIAQLEGKLEMYH